MSIRINSGKRKPAIEVTESPPSFQSGTTSASKFDQRPTKYKLKEKVSDH
jgi:hypothetical protein